MYNYIVERFSWVIIFDDRYGRDYFINWSVFYLFDIVDLWIDI